MTYRLVWRSQTPETFFSRVEEGRKGDACAVEVDESNAARSEHCKLYDCSAQEGSKRRNAGRVKITMASSLSCCAHRRQLERVIPGLLTQGTGLLGVSIITAGWVNSDRMLSNAPVEMLGMDYFSVGMYVSDCL
jgi:hypothetical protein